jgi:hypothetical protein
MHLATEGTWTGSYTGATIDGSDMWNAITTNSASPHTDIVHYVSSKSAAACVQKNMVKLNYQESLVTVATPEAVFTSDADPGAANFQCDFVSFLTGDDAAGSQSPSSKPTAKPTSAPSISPTASPSATAATTAPSAKPSSKPTSTPSVKPTSKPTASPTAATVSSPTTRPTVQPVRVPTAAPISRPSAQPVLRPPTRPTKSEVVKQSLASRIVAAFRHRFF